MGGSEILFYDPKNIVLNLLGVPEDELLHWNQLSIHVLHHEGVLIVRSGEVGLDFGREPREKGFLQTFR